MNQMPCSSYRARWKDCLVLLAVASEREFGGKLAGADVSCRKYSRFLRQNFTIGRLLEYLLE